MAKGKLIVFDGLDGSGKATQTEILLKRLKKEGYKVAAIDFPQYEKFFGQLVGRYLAGEFASAAKEVSPYLASLLYALDRWQAREQIKKWLNQGRIIISNRYATANMIHQAGKIRDKRKRANFLAWLNKLEFEILGIPRPDLVIFLYVPYKISQKLVDGKRYRKYLKGRKRDIHEASKKHLKAAEKAALELVKQYKWKKIECVEKNQILSREKIHEKIWQKVRPFIGHV